MMGSELQNMPFTEGDIEGRTLDEFKKIFSWLNPSDIRFQTSFTFRLGHAAFKIDGQQQYIAKGRADIIVSCKETPLAILELKKPGLKLTEDDFKQGQSYARNLTPPAPLVIVSNGAETNIYTAFDGKKWPSDGADKSEVTLEKTIAAALKITTDQQRDAISLLMGPSTDLWVQAVRESSRLSLEDLSGEWTDDMKPIVKGFCIKRDATERLIKALMGTKKTILVSGEPLSGKTNVLAQLIEDTKESTDLVALYIDLHASEISIFRKVASLLEAALGWPAQEHDARNWIVQLSRRSVGPTLVLAIDGLNSGNQILAGEVNELASSIFGEKLRIVACINAADERRLTIAADGRSCTQIGRAVEVLSIPTLTDDEFHGMRQLLKEHRMLMTPGSERSAEWRQPWMVRLFVSGRVDLPALKNSQSLAMLPPFLGIRLLSCAVDKFSSTDDVRESYGQLAKAVICEAGQLPASATSRLEFLSNFTLSFEAAMKVLSQDQISHMLEQGFWRKEYKGSGQSAIIPRVPELLAAEVAQQLADELVKRVKDDPPAAADWLVRISSNLPFGPVIAAAALLDAGTRDAMSVGVVEALLNRQPRQEKLKVGSKFAMLTQQGLLNVTVLSEGKLELSLKGKPSKTITDADGDPILQVVDMFPWLILSYLASTPMEVSSGNDEEPARGDYLLLFEIGSCQIVLRGPEGLMEEDGHLSHQIEGHGEVACHKNGIIEPITQSMRMAILRDGVKSDVWVSEAIRSGSIPLMMRLLTVFETLHMVVDKDLQIWGREIAQKVRLQINRVHNLDH